ncbi:hypothetical protein O181_013014 [Austropuccinia psidii MF-1]|uniref:RecF/RecN/SMC N-terminal domain-containing protein n=1 Tax=Austropuccinia psidii MF-1 TaxID=1389203 RepID=A0A9Q3BXD7_9BASI|nr:hypothetical protein [Austropuccinia psidii MF-1]
MVYTHSPPEDDDTPPPQKRIRADTDEDEIEIDQPLDELGSEYESDAAEEAFIERAFVEMANQPPTTGSIREAGAISKVILVQFMCHQHQVVDLGPQINFVIGHNGSGKSAVLTAITLVLGAKVKSTSRGTSLKNFIREGQNKAEVTLHLSNRGDEAFKPEIYGDEIIIERTLSKDGSSTYKIKSGRDHRVVSHKKETLQSILDYFMIQADNPLNVLNQDDAKRFLNASSSKQKYEFFIKGTQLQQLTEEYEEINTNLLVAKTLLDKKRRELPDLYEDAKSAQRTLKEIQEASQAQEKITRLQHELTWIYVAEAESTSNQTAEALQKEERLLPKLHDKIQEIEAKITETKNKIAKIEKEKVERNDEALEARRLTLMQTLRQKTEEIKAINAHLRDADATLKKLDSDILIQTNLIAEENAKSLSRTDSSRQETMDKINHLDNEIEALQTRSTQIPNIISNTNEMAKGASERAQESDHELKRLQSEINAARRSIEQSQTTQKNRILLFGHAADKLKEAIEANATWNEKPIGPLGMYIQVTEKAWQPVLETVLANSLKAYLVTNERDEKMLRSLMAKFQCQAPIIRSRRDLFDYAQGEPSAQYLTVLRALKFEDEFAKRALINDLRVEKTILVEHRRQGDPIMTQPKHLRPNIEICYTRDGFRVGGIVGGRQSIPLNMYRGPPRLSSDDGSFVRNLTQRLQEYHQSLEQCKNAIATAHTERRQFTDQLQNLKGEEKHIRDKLRKFREQKAALQDDFNQDISANISALEDMKQELEAEKRKVIEQTKGFVQQKEQLNREIDPLKAERESLQLQLDNRLQEEEALNRLLTEKVAEKVNFTETLKNFQQSLSGQALKIAEARKAHEAAAAELEKTIAQAKEITGSDVILRTSRPRKKVIADLELVTKLVKTTESRHGTSLEEIEARCHQATTAYFETSKEYKDQGKSLKILKIALALRKERWLQFRTHIAVRAKMKFVNHLSKRDYTGKLQFNHNTQRLDIQVNPNEQGTTQAKLKDAKALSGGEKSFSTISLLLTLWDAINCPIRCLDEFDVFMDDVNRRISVNMMIDSAKEANDVQYVFITPNGLGFVQAGPETKIIKMHDPNRMQGSLATGQI